MFNSFNSNKKERLYISDILAEPVITYPSFYTLSIALIKNDMLQQSLIDIHSFNFDFYNNPKYYEEIFNALKRGEFPIFKQKYVIGYFGSKLMYLESNGWRALPCNKDSFNLENWLIA